MRFKNFKQIIQEELEESARIKLLTSKTLTKEIEKAAGIIIDSIKKEGKVFIAGNGGSAADAQHMAADLMGKFRVKRSPIKALALTTDTSIITAVANDYDYSLVFVRQLQALGEKKDCLVAISTSGNSKNILKLVKYAKEKKIKVIALTGGNGGKLKDLADVSILVPSQIISHIQETHMAIEHALCFLAESSIKDNNNSL